MDRSSAWVRACSPRRDQRGATAVEFALLAPLLMGLILGMFSGGQAYDQSLSVTHAVREGTRRGVATPLDNYGFGNGSAWVQAVRDVTLERANGNLGVGGASVCIAVVSGSNTVYNPSGNPYTTNGDGSSCFSDGGADSTYRVQVRGERPAYIDVMFVRMNITLSSRSVGKVEAQPL